MKHFLVVLLVVFGFIVAQEGTYLIELGGDDALGSYLTDSEGNSLYLFTNDAEGESQCYEQCAVNWPPFIVQDGVEITVVEGINSDLLTTTERNDGSLQVSYHGWPLYYFVGDEVAGDVNGHERGDVWYLVSAEGLAVGSEEAMAAMATGSEISDEVFAKGEGVYSANCAACHIANGTGGEGPSLIGNSKLENPGRVIRQVINGGHFMPPFGHLSDGDVAAVATYIRTAWGNDYGAVTAEEVGEQR